MKWIVLISVLLARTAGDLSFKWALHNRQFNTLKATLDELKKMTRHPAIWIGIVCAILNLTLWTIVASQFPLSLAYPFLSLSFVTIIGGGWLWFGEKIDRYKLMGIVCILVGVYVLWM